MTEKTKPTQMDDYFMKDDSLNKDNGYTTELTYTMHMFIDMLESRGIKITPAQKDTICKYNGDVSYEFIEHLVSIGVKDMCISFHRDGNGNEMVYYNCTGCENDLVVGASISINIK